MPIPDQNRLTQLEVVEVSLVPMGANNKTFILFKSLIPSEKDGTRMAEDLKPAGADGTAGASRAQVTKGDLETIQKSLEDEKKAREAIQKRLDEAEAARVALEKQVAEEKAAKDEINKRLDEERNKRILKEFMEKAGSIPSLGKPEEVAPILKDLSEKAPQSYALLEPILKAMDARIQEGSIFDELGRSGTSSVAGSAEEKLKAIAKSILDKGEAADMATAYTKACADNEDLYEDYVAEKRRR